MQNWEFFIRNFDQGSNKLIAKEDLLRLDIQLLVPGYLEKGKSRFSEVMEEYDKESNTDNIEKERTVSDLKKEIIKKGSMKKKRTCGLNHLQ